VQANGPCEIATTWCYRNENHHHHHRHLYEVTRRIMYSTDDNDNDSKHVLNAAVPWWLLRKHYTYEALFRKPRHFKFWEESHYYSPDDGT